MRREGTLILLLLLVLSGLSPASQNFAARRPAASRALPAEAIREPRVGERLRYEVSWMGIPVGLGELWVKERIFESGREMFHIVAVARTNDFLSKIYSVEDVIHSYLDTTTLTSVRFRKTVREGSYRADEAVTYDEAAQKGRYESMTNGSTKSFDIGVPARDVVAAFFWVRRQRFEIGRSVKTGVNNGEKDYDLTVEVISREAKEMRGMGVRDVFLIEPKTALKGVLEKRGRVWIHLENTPERTPLLITFKTPFGPITGVLKSAEQGVE